jgi:integrase
MFGLRQEMDFVEIEALLLGCGLRRAELIALKLAHLQQRDDRWAIVDPRGEGLLSHGRGRLNRPLIIIPS